MSVLPQVVVLDVGGSSIKSGVVTFSGEVEDTQYRLVESASDADYLLDCLESIINKHISVLGEFDLAGLCIAFPGPFDYEQGISWVQGLCKYDALYGVNVRHALGKRLRVQVPIVFCNDAEAAILGECVYGTARNYSRVIGVTLGTGMGSAFIKDGIVQRSGKGVPENGWLYEKPFGDKRADDLFSSRGLKVRLEEAGIFVDDLVEAVKSARNHNKDIRMVIEGFWWQLIEFLKPYVKAFSADAVLVMGGLSAGFDLCPSEAKRALSTSILVGEHSTEAALIGAGRVFQQKTL